MAAADRRGRPRFAGPLLPGPDWNEPIAMFRDDILERDCSGNPRVRDYLDQRRALEPANVLRKLGQIEELFEAVGSIATRLEALGKTVQSLHHRIEAYERDDRALRRDLDRTASHGGSKVIPFGD